MKLAIGRVERAFAVLLLAYIASIYIPGLSAFQLLLKAAAVVLGGWVFLRLARGLVVRLLWRLRNRLIVSYIFIALVPVVLITLLIVLGISLVGGQLTIYMLTSGLERRAATIRNAIEPLANADVDPSAWAGFIAPQLAAVNPGLNIRVEDASAPVFSWPRKEEAPVLAGGWRPGNGLVLSNNQLYAWAYVTNGRRHATALVPVTREYLGMLAPDVCESTITAQENYETVLHLSLPDAGPSHNRFPPKVNFADFAIGWSIPIPVNVQNSPDEQRRVWLQVKTRPSALLRELFTQVVDISGELIAVIFVTVAILFLIAEIVALVIGVSLTRTITGAVHDLYQGTVHARNSDFGHRIPIHGKDQLGELAVSFNEMTANMQRLLLVEKERERLQAELEIAREVQNQLYPRKLPEVQRLTLTAVCDPARMVSGDYYDYQQLSDQCVAIAIGDVAGKGISAALLMATVQSSFRSQLRACIDNKNGGMSTSLLVDRLNKQLYADTAPEKYATFYLGVYDDNTSTLTYTNAGHLPPILIRNGTAERLEVNGMVVGAFPFARYAENELRLERGDLVIFFTDGISEPENPYGEMFGEERLTELVLRNAHLPESQIVDSVMNSVREWTGSDELQDDMTLLVLRRR